MADIERFAKRERLTVGEWARRVLRQARSSRPAICFKKSFTATQRSIDGRQSGRRSKAMLDIVDDVIPTEKGDVYRIQMSGRDAVHMAVMERHDIQSILSFDGDFDRWPGLQGIHRV